MPAALKVPTSGWLAGTFRRYMAHPVRAGHLASRSVAMVGVDSPTSGTVTSTGAPPGSVVVCRALRAMSAPVAPPSAVVTSPSIAPGVVVPPRAGTRGMVPMAVPARTPKVTVALYGTPALVNAAMTHVVNADDAHKESMGHPGAVVIPAALVVGEMVGASGASVLEAVIGAKAK